MKDPNEAAKGRTLSLWLSGDPLKALDKALVTPLGRFKEGSYCAEAVIQRLQREGHLKTGAASEVAAQAYELSRQFGPEAVKAKLLELTTQQTAAAL